MTKKIIFPLLAIYFVLTAAFAQTSSNSDSKLDITDLKKGQSLKDNSFVVETSQDSLSEGINRISGDENFDNGYTSKENTYKSHKKTDPFHRDQNSDSASADY